MQATLAHRAVTKGFAPGTMSRAVIKSFQAAVANEVSPVTSHKNLQCHLEHSALITCNIKQAQP